MEYRMEHDSMGDVRVPADRYWGAQTQRSFENFPIGQGREPMPPEIIHAFGILKKAAAITNARLCPTAMTAEKCGAICAAADEIISGKLSGHFPLVVWQTGSGTQTNMNANEVIANRGNELAGRRLLHPNDDVNRSQSSNDTFPTALHIAAVCALEDGVLPALAELIDSLKRLEAENEGVIKAGRTHLQDATPISFPQEISGWRSSLERDAELIRLALPPLRELALGGTAVGTGLNAPAGFAEEVAAEISRLTGKDFRSAPNKFHALTSRDELVFAHGALQALAGDLMKLANDIRWLGSGPRNGLGELFLPENEPGSSIMPGKVNPTQCEALTMSAVQKAAESIVVEVRRQFREITGIMEYKVDPDYSACVDLCTKGALHEMVAPAILAVVVPILTGLILGPTGVVGLLGGVSVTGFAMAVFMSNAGGAWDNAKKYIEAGHHGGKGSNEHKAAVVGDTVGDPFKDTSGPSLNILIKLCSTVSIVFAGLIIRFSLL